VNNYPPLVYGAGSRVNVFKEEATDMRQSNAASMPYRYDISPGYFDAAATSLLAGRGFSWHDDNNAPPVAVVNREFAGEIFGSATRCMRIRSSKVIGCFAVSCAAPSEHHGRIAAQRIAVRGMKRVIDCSQCSCGEICSIADGTVNVVTNRARIQEPLAARGVSHEAVCYNESESARCYSRVHS